MTDAETAEFLEILADQFASDMAIEDALREAAAAIRENIKATTATQKAISAASDIGGVICISTPDWTAICDALGLSIPSDQG